MAGEAEIHSGNRAWRYLRRGLLLLGTVVVALYLALPLLSRAPHVQRWLERFIESRTPYSVRFDDLRIGYDLSAIASSVSISANGSGPPFLTAERARAGLDVLKLGSGQPLHVELDSPQLYVGRLPATSSGGEGTGAVPLSSVKIRDGVVHYTAAGREVVLGPFDLTVRPGGGEGRLEASKLQVTAGTFTLAGQAQLPFELRDGAIDFRSNGLQLQNLAGKAGELEWKLAGATVKGRIDLSDMHASLQLAAAGLEMHDPQSLRAADKVELRGTLEASLASSSAVDADLSMPAGEILWNRFYADLGRFGLELRAKGRYDGSSVEVASGALTATGIGTIAIEHASISSKAQSGGVSFDLPGLSELYDLGFAEPYGEVHPKLASMKIDGRLRGKLDFQNRPGAQRVSGEVDLTGAQLASAELGIDVRDLNVNLPVSLGDGGLAPAPRTGLLRLGTLRLGSIEVDALAMVLSVRPNRIAVLQPVRVPVLGGAVTLTALDAKRLWNAEREVRFNVAVQDLDLARLSPAMGWPRLKGNIAGTVPDVTVSNGSVQTEGEILIHVFGGVVRVRNLRIDQLLTPIPTLKLDVDFHDISLGQVTDTLDVGHVSGVARGEVRDLAIVNGQPLRFEASIETVDKPGVAQRISITALQQISILAGPGGDILSHGILSFFDEYRYAKMGFRCRLENDRFTLHGVEESDGNQYLVVGSFLPPRVNVVSHTQVIDFSEMVRRLSRAFAAREKGKEATATPSPADDERGSGK